VTPPPSTLQTLSDVVSGPPAVKSIAARADKRFFWNRVMAAPLMGELLGIDLASGRHTGQ